MPYFRKHQASRAQDFQISGPRIGLRSKRPTIWFSRRLDNPDGSFGGVAVVAVEPPFLTTFHDESVLAKGESITVRHIDGSVLALKSGSEDSREV